MLRGEFEKLLQILRPESFMDKNDLQLLKDKVFGPQVFFVTETRLTDDFSPDAGWLVSPPPWLKPAHISTCTSMAGIFKAVLQIVLHYHGMAPSLT